jgi:hypothetical protein
MSRHRVISHPSLKDIYIFTNFTRLQIVETLLTIMEQITLKIKDSSKLSFLMQLIKQLDFVEVENIKDTAQSTNYDFFASAGLWENRELDSKELREQAWNRQK